MGNGAGSKLATLSSRGSCVGRDHPWVAELERNLDVIRNEFLELQASNTASDYHIKKGESTVGAVTRCCIPFPADLVPRCGSFMKAAGTGTRSS